MFIRYLRRFFRVRRLNPQDDLASALIQAEEADDKPGEDELPDETVFVNPDQLDIKREPSKHLSFGQGIRFCSGAPLARMKAQIAINTLLQHLPNLRLKVSPDALRWRPGMFLRGLDALPLSCDDCSPTICGKRFNKCGLIM